MYYRRRPEMVLAYQLSVDNMLALEAWCGGAIKGTKLPVNQRVIEIHVRGEEIRAEIGDWIVKGFNGSFSVMDAVAFQLAFEPTIPQ